MAEPDGSRTAAHEVGHGTDTSGDAAAPVRCGRTARARTAAHGFGLLEGGPSTAPTHSTGRRLRADPRAAAGHSGAAFRRLPPDLLALLRRQRWVLGRWQPEMALLPARTTRRALGEGLWRPMTPRTILALPIDPGPEHFCIAAVLELGPWAVLAGASSLVEWKWSGDDPVCTDVLIPHNSNLRKRRLPSCIRPRYGRTERGLVVRHGLAMTGAADAAVDAASWARSDREAGFILVSVVQQRLATPPELLRTLQRRPRVRRRRLIGEVAGEIAGGATSIPELEFLRECRRRGLPTPRMQVRRRDAAGRARCTDAEFALADGGLLIVEINGRGHEEPARTADDMVRNSALARATGAHVIPVASWQLRADPDPLFTEIAARVRPQGP